jgi:deoxyribodipyrimidine photo-lyase
METEKKYKRSMFVFRRDFRIMDNIGLLKATQDSEVVIPVFIFDERQCLVEKNAYFGHASVEFMIESLDLLDKQLQEVGSRLFYYFGSYPDIFTKVLDEVKPEGVYVNEDYTPFSIKRDQEIKALCTAKGVGFHSYNDIMLVEKGVILKADKTFYTDYAPYYVKASKIPVPRPNLEVPKNFIPKTEKFESEFVEDKKKFYEPQPGVTIRAGRENAYKILDNMGAFLDYAKTRALADKPTTQISTYMKYGSVSIREVYWAIVDNLGKKHDLIRQLHWRDFYYNVLYFFPDAIYDAYWPQFRDLEWPENEEWMEAWKWGKTGYPLIDAAMRCLNTTHFIPNSLRLSVSNFLAKVLCLDWRYGQRWFANQLLDYDLALNNGGWQWSASTGAVCQPFNVVFNPYSQSQTMDKDCNFIKEWIPELKDVPAKHIHKWPDHYQKYGETGYPAPIVDFEGRKAFVVTWYKALYSREIPGASKKVHQKVFIDPDTVLLKEDMFENEIGEGEGMKEKFLEIDDF